MVERAVQPQVSQHGALQPKASGTLMDRGPRDEAGVVLLLVMALIAVSISIAYATAKTSAVEVLSTRQREHLARAQLLAHSGIALATRAEFRFLLKKIILTE